MIRDRTKRCLSAVFIDYDNIYLSLKRTNEAAARKFAKSPRAWLRAIEDGDLIKFRDAELAGVERRIVLNRSYGNTALRRTGKDNATDPQSFPFVRKHFVHAGCEVVDCPPLTAQLKNSSDIRMVMDMRDFLTHDTHIDEFIILSGDSDFTPVLHRLRTHARRTVVYVNEQTATPYSAVADGEIREKDLIDLLVGHETADAAQPSDTQGQDAPADAASGRGRANPEIREAIMAVVMSTLTNATTAVPIEVLADRAQRELGHDVTVGTEWAGSRSFLNFLNANLPFNVQLTTEPPFLAFDPTRHARPGAPESANPRPVEQAAPGGPTALATLPESAPSSAPPGLAPPAPAPALDLGKAIARIHDACQAPAIEPRGYRAIFLAISAEVSQNGVNGMQTLQNIVERAASDGLTIGAGDVRFVFDVVSESDPWFEQGATPQIFAVRFRSFVVARCRGQGMNLTRDELDLIDAWFTGDLIARSPENAAQPDDVPYLPPLEPEGSFWNNPAAGPRPGSLPGQQPPPAQAGDHHHPPPPAVSAIALGDLADVDIGQMPRIVRSRMRS